MLPTNGDVLRNILQNQIDMENNQEVNRAKFADKNKCINDTVEEVERIWEEALGDRKTVSLISKKAIAGILVYVILI